MELWEVLVPCKSNAGKPFRTRHHREWDVRHPLGIRRVRRVRGHRRSRIDRREVT